MIESSNQWETRRKMIGWLKLKWQGLGRGVVEQLKAQGNDIKKKSTRRQSKFKATKQ